MICALFCLLLVVLFALCAHLSKRPFGREIVENHELHDEMLYFLDRG